MEVAKRLLLSVPRDPVHTNTLIPRRDSNTFAEPIVVAQPKADPAGSKESESTLGVKPPTYQALVSPMPLLLDNLAVSITSIPTCNCEEDEDVHRVRKGSNDTSNSSSVSSAYGDDRCYSSRPTPSELSINAPDCRDEDTDSGNTYMFHNHAARTDIPPRHVSSNERTSAAETDSVVDLWQQVITYKSTPSVAPIQNQRLSSKTPIHFNTVKSNNILDEEKISSV